MTPPAMAPALLFFDVVQAPNDEPAIFHLQRFAARDVSVGISRLRDPGTYFNASTENRAPIEGL